MRGCWGSPALFSSAFLKGILAVDLNQPEQLFCTNAFESVPAFGVFPRGAAEVGLLPSRVELTLFFTGSSFSTSGSQLSAKVQNLLVARKPSLAFPREDLVAMASAFPLQRHRWGAFARDQALQPALLLHAGAVEASADFCALTVRAQSFPARSAVGQKA